MYGLFRPRQWQLAPRYITPQEFRGIVEALTPIGADTSLQDKFAFEAVCKQSGLPCIETIMVLGSTTLENTSPDNMKAHRLQECDLFIKPVSARSGSGTEMWSWTTSGFVNHRGEVRTSRELLEHLVQRSTSQAILVQRRIKNHRTISEHFGISALSTVRIVTTLTDAGQPNLFQALFKMPRKHSIVDNLGAGGIGCGVQLDTGRLEAGHVKANHESLHEHPDTGALITGFALPQWQEVRRTALDAHRAFSNVAIIGWDIGISDSGPVIIEGNPFPAVESLQQSHGPLEVNPNFWPFIRTAATNSQSVESNNYLA
ncbi:sugar-transfer associated ATP-grasp domain-containing protein [Aquisalimonas lutea]|uniref:sugar-transfer associated ATP-grasp domain-containing protein n=1 Tax=Aquisalimonas lutea TaxID=1327750 RepID=UPI0025B4BC98|nr:sugar-transfer associated ATP-grasp domain-containing protein [Aquisalimonas lutea]MDN3517195.1 sugar-transfer associated ATP-grasp domain-containing protein [Aquisalimonas lutea]